MGGFDHETKKTLAAVVINDAARITACARLGDASGLKPEEIRDDVDDVIVIQVRSPRAVGEEAHVARRVVR
jgi:hypothetical protein